MEKLRQLLFQKGSALVGYADLGALPAEHRLNMRYGISIAVSLSAEIISGIRQGPTKEYYAEYCRANALLDYLTIIAATFLQAQGWKAKPFAATNEGIFPETLSTCLPHKTVATLAGLGWIGKCALLVTEKYGSAVRISTILTNAELPCGIPITASKCKQCSLCVDACPVHAASGQDWKPGLNRDTFFDPFSCRKFARQIAVENTGIVDTFCGICIAVCPFTEKYLKDSQAGL
ncbi:MAG: 4Fe-4S double cluster binding domain-containing protein [Sedimentisphaerales bacterium]|jgi:epoxyqueuosine reductase QueG